MTTKLSAVPAILLVYLLSALPGAGFAASNVEQNSNVVGTTLPGYYRGMPAMQDNEPSCAINPILARNIVCAWNASGGADDVIGDTWVRFSESLDGGRTFFNRYLNGSNLNPATSVGQQFGADPVMMCWPGGCGTIMLAATRAETGGEGGGIYMQMMVDLNTESGFRKAFKVNLDQVYRSTGSKFADKPHGLYVLNETDPGTVTVTMPVEMPDGSVETITREWPKATIIVVFALFNPSKNDIEIMVTQTENYGGDWSNPKQVAQTSGRDQGVSVAALGDNVLYAFRRFANGTDNDAMMGVITTLDGQRISKPFEIASNICAYDAPTLPNAVNNSAAAARSNDFPWVSQNGSKFIMVYSERRRSLDGGCLTNTAEPSDSRIMAVVGSANGKNWSTPKEVAPNPGHGFQFMPVVDCSLGVCQVAWWDSRRNSQRTRDFLTAQGDAFSLAALNAFETLPIFADFNFSQAPGGQVIQFRGTADMFTKKVYLDHGPLDTSDEAVLASRYRLGLYNGDLREMEANPFHVKAYKSSQVPFMGDYNSMTSVKHRLVFDPADPTAPLVWESNAGPDALHPNAIPLFWLAWTDARNMRGQIYTAEIDGTLPYTKTPVPVAANNETSDRDGDELDASEQVTLAASSVEDSNPGAGFCTPVSNPGPGGQFIAINNRVKDADIYGALIENMTSAWALNPTKTLGNIQRTYTIVAENAGPDPRLFRFEIANQPDGYPTTARVSWVQVPFDPLDPTFATTEPTIVAFEPAGPRSSATVALFLVSQEPVNPVTVRVYDHASGELVNTITVNGSIEAGPLLNPDGSFNELELHNPLVYAPDQYNPDQFNPDQYNPDQFNPDLYNPDQFNPDQFNPDQFNPDQFNPDQYNPDQFNPDLFNPDQFNPDQFNPDQFNPDQFNSSLTDSGDLHNPEIPDPDLSTIERDADGTVVRIDVNYGIKNTGNTVTAYSVDFAVADPDVLALIENGEITTQLIAWQDKQIRDVQFCEPALISENRIIAAVNNPDLTTLNIPDIYNNRVGSLTYSVGPDDIMQNALRFIGPRDKIEIVANALANDIISYVFASQAANTGEYDLGIGREQVVNDRTPARFNRSNGDIETFEASGPTGVILPTDFVTASKDGEDVPVSCTPALGTPVGLDIDNDPAGFTALSCQATSSNGVTAQLDMAISVVDTMAPVIDPDSVPGDIVVEADSTDGSFVTYATPTATDVFGVDPNVDVACVPASGSLFAFSAPDPTTTQVTCTATDDSGNVDSASFDVTVQDTSAPVFPPDFPGSTTPDTEPFVLAPDANSFQLFWGPFDVTDSDPNIDVSCNVGELVPGPTPPYTFVYDFPVGDTTVTCTATDSNGASVSASFNVTIVDETPPVITLNGPETLTLETNSGPYTDPGATATDNADGDVSVTIDSSAVDTTTAGTYTVLLTATDSSGNTTQLTRTVIVEFVYGMTGIIPTKTNVKIGSSNPLEWAWLGPDGMPVDSSGDIQYLTIRNCETGEIILAPAGDPGASGFRYKVDNWWQFNWETFGEAGKSYCAAVRSGLTDQVQYSPPIRLR